MDVDVDVDLVGLAVGREVIVDEEAPVVAEEIIVRRVMPLVEVYLLAEGVLVEGEVTQLLAILAAVADEEALALCAPLAVATSWRV